MNVNVTDQDTSRPKHYAGIKLLSIIAGGFFLLLVAVMLVPSVLNVDYMFTMGAVLIVLPLCSFIVCVVWSRGLTAERRPVEPMVEGEVRQVEMTLGQRFPTNLIIEVIESLPAGLDSEPRMPIAAQLPGGRRLSFELRSTKRGLYTIGPMRVRAFDPLGVIGLTRRFAAESEVVVYPRALALEPWNLVSGASPTGWLGEALARPAHGATADFYGTRKYYPGDDLRRVHWKSAARARELVVKEFTDDMRAEDVVIALDLEWDGSDRSDRSDAETPLDYAARAAAFVAERSLALGGGVALATAATLGSFTTRAENIGQLPLILDRLARAQADSDMPLAEVLSTMSPRLREGMAVVIIGSRVDDGLRAAAARLLSRGVVLAQIYIDPTSFKIGSTSKQDAAEYALDVRIPCWRIERGGEQ